MKKILTIFLGIALILPLYSQEDDYEDYDYYDDYDDEYENVMPAPEAPPAPEVKPAPEAPPAPEVKPAPAVKPAPVVNTVPEEETESDEKKKADFARQGFEIGLDLGAGFGNGLVGLSDIFKKKVVIDLSKIAQSVPENGTGFNFGLNFDLFMNVKNIHIGEGLWDFGFIVNVDGSVNLNIPKSMFDLIAEGNAEQHDSSGQISASGGIYTEIGLTSLAKYQVAEKTLFVGIKPAIYTPVVYVSPGSGISYQLSTVNDDGEEGLFIKTEGEISVYTATSFDNIEPGRFIFGANGFDISLEAGYAFFPFLDAGLSFSSIPIAPATLTTEMKMRMNEFKFGLKGEDIIGGKDPLSGDDEDSENSDLEFGDPIYNNNAQKKVYRPLRFDVYARYKPFNSEFVVIRPNIGFSANVNEGDEKGYFNAGLELSMNLINLFTLYLGSGYKEEIWRQRIGLALNLRAFELDLQAVFRDQTFEGCFMGRGFEFNLGMRFGW